jgi:hypothetical protein
MVGLPPDFLLRLLASANFMRLSLMKAAHAVTGKATHRKSGYIAGFWRDVGFHGAPSDSLRHTEFFNDPNSGPRLPHLAKNSEIWGTP